MKFLKVIGIGVLVLILACLLGPRPVTTPMEDARIEPWHISLDSVDRYVRQKEQGLAHLKPDNESRIYWAGDSVHRTRYSVVYLHGFSASPMESNPTHIEYARRMGFNLYIPLLAGHGVDDKESFATLTPNQLITSAKEGIAVGQLLGEDVIVMSCSTGGTLSLYLAGANPEMIDALILYSPNVALFDKKAGLVTGPWGSQLVQAILGPYHQPDSSDFNAEVARYWTTQYRSEGVIALQQLIDQTMKPEIFQSITQPYFLGYFYKNEEVQDPVVSVAAMLQMDQETSTPETMKKRVAFPEAGAHVMTNPLKSPNWKQVLDSTLAFTREILRLEPLEQVLPDSSRADSLQVVLR